MSASISNAAIQDALARAKQLANTSTPESAKRAADYDLDGGFEERPVKRAYSEEGFDMAGNPIATLGGGMPPGMADMANHEVLVEQFEVPDHAVGLVIGRGGEQISQIQQMSGCRVQMAQDSGGPSRPCTLQGSKVSIEVPDHAVGLVIGRGGEQISQIQQISGCRVQMAQVSGGPSRPCTLQGSKVSIEKAKELINGVINRSGGRPPPPKMGGMGGGMGMGMGGMPGGADMGGMGGMMGNAPGPGQITEEMMISGTKCGLVIGKGGETIKMIQERCGVKVVLIQDNIQPGATAKPLRIIGDPQKVAMAKSMVEEIVNSRGDGMGGGGPSPMGGGPMGGGGPGYGSPYGGGAGMQKSIGEVIVPKSSVGVIIGKGGETIRRLSTESGAKIQFKQDEDQQALERTAVIQGTPDQIQKATQLISDLVNRSSDNANVFYMHIPANKTGLVIGRGGETIKQICAESGAHVELSRDPPPNANEKVFVIKGSDQQIHHAQHIIRIKVGDLPPGTPFQMAGGPGGGDFGGGGGGYGANGGGGGGGWGGGGGDQSAAWAQYYAQMGQGGGPGPGGPGGPAQPYQQPYQQPAAAASAPAINPQTGQPDYSAQWAEYYRNLGMHDQAAMIEAQAKQNAAGPAAPQQPQQPQQPNFGAPGGGGPGGPGGAPGGYGGGYGGQAPQGNGGSYPGGPGGPGGFQQPY